MRAKHAGKGISMKIKNLFAILTISAAIFSNTICASAAVPAGAFDAEYYASVYADLEAAFGNDEEALYKHYLQNGILEGRFGSPDFDVRTYRERYPDLEDAFGDDWDAYFWHYLAFGIREGRNAIADGAPAPKAEDGVGISSNAAENDAAETTEQPIVTSEDQTPETRFDDSLAQDAFRAVNQYRIDNGKSELNWSDALYEAAKVRAEEIVCFFSHTRPNGDACFAVLNEKEISYRYAGENIAAGQPTGQSVATAWYNSESHKNNMLSEKYKTAAIACYVENGRCYWVNFFTN